MEKCHKCGYEQPERVKELKIRVERIENVEKFFVSIRPVFSSLVDDGTIGSWVPVDYVCDERAG